MSLSPARGCDVCHFRWCDSVMVVTFAVVRDVMLFTFAVAMDVRVVTLQLRWMCCLSL